MTTPKSNTAILLAVFWLLAWIPSAAAERETGFVPKTNLSAWTETFREKGLTVYAMKTADSGVMAFRATGVLAAPIDQIMEVLRKVEIAGQWMPDVVDKITIDNISDLEAVTYSINKLPWPFAGRELILKNALRLDADNRFLVVDIYSVERKDIPQKEGAVRAVMHCGQTRLRPAGSGRTEMDIILFVDPKGAIPTWLVNIAQRRMPYDFLRALEKKAAATHYPLRPAFRSLLERLVDTDDAKTAPTDPITTANQARTD
ncbi:MAG: START domain-containing protein [Pseudomonadota bacterium]